MFLVNSPPVVAFPTQWMPFGPKTTHKVPLSVVHAEQIHKAPNLLGILDSQQSNESSCAVKVEYERIMQKNRKGELSNDRGLKASATLFKGHTREQASSTLPTQFKVQEEESSPALDSDSDDSVDRGIEEAIQEYLKNRSTADASSTAAATKNPSPSDHSDQLKTACSNAPARKSPVKMVTSTTTCNAFSTLDCSRCSSPESVGSDDSFEQSIKDEIEQFLNQKKLQNTLSDTSTAKKAAQSNITAKPKQKPFKAAEKQAPKQGIKGLPDKLPSESLQPKSPKQKGDHFKTSIYPKTLSSSVKPRDQKNEAASRQCEELSDSSSDDGIEEAIQLYQLEKSRLEGNPVVVQKCSLEKEANSTTTYSATLSPCQEKKSSPESHTNTDYKKRKLPSSSHAASHDTATNLPPTTKRTFYFGDDANAKCEIATRRAETAAELMCAEAILDISKAILPSQPETACVISQERPPTQPKSPCVSDSSVDSDDGIEQEIQTFLARKAQEESLAMSPIKQSSPNPQRLDQRKQHCLSNKTLSQKGKVIEIKAVQKDMVGKGEKRNTDVIGIASTVLLSPEILQTRNTDVGMKEHSKASYKSEEVKQIVQETTESLLSLPRITGGKRKMYTKMRSNCSVDTSSSLDSDEDLDSAIKDLLRSKRKCKKRPKDGRPQYKKRVRFGETTTRTLESLGSGGDLMDCLLKPAVKSCLVYSSNSQENTLNPNFNVTEDKRSVASNSDISPNKPECKPASASDKPLDLSSALPEAQDSSSVDSDDSIEQEIRKFLAERARESAELCAVQKAPQSVTSLSVFTQTPTMLSNPTPIKQEPRVLSISETETILQKVMEKDRSTAPVPQPTLIQRVQDYKDVVPQVRLIQRPPAEVPKISAAVHSVIVKRECFIDKNRVVRPAEKVLQTAPERVIVKTGVNGSQGSSPVSGNFVAGLKYISGTDQQLLLNMGKASSTRMATELYSPGGNITRLGTCQPVQKKTLILEQPKIVQAPTFSLNTPVVRPALYVVTTKVVKDTPTALCLPINTAAYDAGLNLMSIQYCQSQVAARTPVCTTPFPFQQNRGSEIVVNIPGTPGEALPLGTKAKESQSVTKIASRSYLKEKSAEDIGTGSDVSLNSSGSSAKKENICRSSIDPGWKLEPYIMLSPEEICRNAGRTFCKRMSQDKKADSIHKKTAELLVKKLRF